MRNLLALLVPLALVSCSETPGTHGYTAVEITVVHTDSAGFRALDILPDALAFAGSRGRFGTVSFTDGTVRVGTQKADSLYPEFRAVGHTASDFFMLSAGDPALLYRPGPDGRLSLVYSETGPGVFYDAMVFWDNENGIAVGDARDGCLSILLTRDGGAKWQKLPCASLPAALSGEGAFAASNTNIAVSGNRAWIATSKGRIYRTDDLGAHWEVFPAPALNGTDAQGLFSLAFWDENLGVAVGGDYADPDIRSRNKMRTRDGGETWEVLADGREPGYRSCVQFVPGSGGSDLVAVGYAGISYSGDTGTTWTEVSGEGFYTIRFQNDSVAWAGGKGRMARLVFRK